VGEEVEGEGEALRLAGNRKIQQYASRVAGDKAAYDALPEKGPCNEDLKMVAALTRLSVAQQVVAAMQQAATAMASVGNSVAKKVEKLEAQIRGPSFMGCGK